MKAYLVKANNETVGIVVGDEQEVKHRLSNLNNDPNTEFTIEEHDLLNEETYETFQRIRSLIDSAHSEYYCPDCNQLRLNATGVRVFQCGNCGKPNIIQGMPGTLDKEALSKKFGW